MSYFLHTFLPQSIALQFGSVAIHWYGVFMVCALAAGLMVTLKVARWHGIAKDTIYDLFFYLVIVGFLGARIFYVLYNFNYFWQNPVDIFKIWQGGIAIHGALIFGFAILLLFAKKKKFDVWKLAAVLVSGVALGQAIGRWGNYFNQELFGLPTDLPWGIPIALANRPEGFEGFTYFHPTFLYESIGSMAIFGVLLWWNWRVARNSKPITDNKKIINYKLLVAGYLLLYSGLRFSIELLRIDPTAGSIAGLRATQILSLVMALAAAGYLLFLSTRGTLQKLLH